MIRVYDVNESFIGKLEDWVTVGEEQENLMGGCQTTLSKLMGAPNCLSKIPIYRDGQYQGTVVIFIDKVREDSDRATTIKWKWGAVKLKDTEWFSKSDPFAKFYRQDIQGQKLLIHQTEVIDSNLNPVWKGWMTNTHELCPKNDKFYVEVWDYNSMGGHTFVNLIVKIDWLS